MIQLRENEKVLLVLHRHWIVIVRRIIMFLLLFVVPIFLVFFESLFIYLGLEPFFQPIYFFIMIIYWMVIFGFFLISWVEYWLDVWIITTDRVIDVEQVALFHREISEFSLIRVQNATIKIPNIVATILGFGNITIQTAGEKSFSILDIPNVHEAKKIILENAEKKRGNKEQNNI
ncbi:PH domain-containing protein [Patescibacteria group bacterium]